MSNFVSQFWCFALLLNMKALHVPLSAILMARVSASSKQLLLSVDTSVTVCVSATLMLNVTETKPSRASCPIGAYNKVPMAHRLVSLGYDVKIIMSQIQTRRIQKLGPDQLSVFAL